MTLRSGDPKVENGQASAVQGAGGSRLNGDFEPTPYGWRITLHQLTFSELMRIAEAARRELEQ